MHIAHRALLLLAMAVAAMAFAASPASAQETEVEFVNETTTAPCNPCVAEGEGESHVVALPSGVEINTCHDGVEAYIYHDGSGEVDWIGSAHGGTGCNLVNCTLSHRPLSDPGELGSGTGHLSVTLCLRNPGTGAEILCPAEIDGQVDGGDHEGSYSFTSFCTGGSRRLEGAGTGLITDIEPIHHSE